MGTTVTIRWDEFPSNIIIKWHYGPSSSSSSVGSPSGILSCQLFARDNVSFWCIVVLMMKSGDEKEREGWPRNGFHQRTPTTRRTRRRNERNQNNICPYFPPVGAQTTRRTSGSASPRGLSFSLATQLICTNYSLLIEITLNQSISDRVTAIAE